MRNSSGAPEPKAPEPMVFWLVATAAALIVCATLYYASAGRVVNASVQGTDEAMTAHFRQQLAEIEADILSGRLPQAEGIGARAELAREMLRQQQELAGKRPAGPMRDPIVLPASLAAIVAIAFGSYYFLGNPYLPSQPFAGRPDAVEQQAAQSIDVVAAVKAIEAQLAKSPDDLRGWTVLAPVYMNMQRYADAADAFRHILRLSPPTAKTETDLAVALILENGGAAAAEALAQLRSATALDPKDPRPQFYLAADSMRAGDYKIALGQWQALIALGTSADAWMATARSGLAAAEAGASGKPPPIVASTDDATMIKGMVETLSARLAKDGGTLAEWTRLVRSRLVLKDAAAAQKAYDAARQAYPAAPQRSDLDALAAASGLRIDRSTN